MTVDQPREEAQYGRLPFDFFALVSLHLWLHCSSEDEMGLLETHGGRQTAMERTGSPVASTCSARPSPVSSQERSSIAIAIDVGADTPCPGPIPNNARA